MILLYETQKIIERGNNVQSSRFKYDSIFSSAKTKQNRSNKMSRSSV